MKTKQKYRERDSANERISRVNSDNCINLFNFSFFWSKFIMIALIE